MSILTPTRARVVRKVSFDTSGYHLVNTPTKWFRANLEIPEQVPVPMPDDTPRALSPYYLSWSGTFFGPDSNIAPSHSGDLCQTDNLTFEVLGPPTEIKTGRRVIGYQVPVLPVRVLYPVQADFYEMGGTDPVHTGIDISFYRPSPSQAPDGSYVSYTSEVSLSMQGLIKENMLAVIGGSQYKVVSAVTPPLIAAVTLELRAQRP